MNQRHGLLTALHSQLVGLRSSGVDIDLGLPESDWDDEFRRIEGVLADAPPETVGLPAIDPPPPEPLAQLLDGWLAGGDLAALLEARRQATDGASVCRRSISRDLAYPVAVAVIAVLALGGVCRWLLPLFEAQVDDLRIEPLRSVVALQWLSATAPVWIWLAPIGLIGLAIGIARAPRPQAAAHRKNAEKARALAARPQRDQTHSDGDRQPRGETAPAPLLDWASKEEDAKERSLELRAVGRVYDAMATRSESASTRFAPLAATVLIGGGVCALYALAVFLPVIELLSSLPVYW